MVLTTLIAGRAEGQRQQSLQSSRWEFVALPAINFNTDEGFGYGALLEAFEVPAEEAEALRACLLRRDLAGIEAVLNALCAAETLTGRDGHTSHALPLAEAAGFVAAHL